MRRNRYSSDLHPYPPTFLITMLLSLIYWWQSRTALQVSVSVNMHSSRDCETRYDKTYTQTPITCKSISINVLASRLVHARVHPDCWAETFLHMYLSVHTYAPRSMHARTCSCFVLISDSIFDVPVSRWRKLCLLRAPIIFYSCMFVACNQLSVIIAHLRHAGAFHRIGERGGLAVLVFLFPFLAGNAVFDS